MLYAAGLLGRDRRDLDASSRATGCRARGAGSRSTPTAPTSGSSSPGSRWTPPTTAAHPSPPAAGRAGARTRPPTSKTAAPTSSDTPRAYEPRARPSPLAVLALALAGCGSRAARERPAGSLDRRRPASRRYRSPPRRRRPATRPANAAARSPPRRSPPRTPSSRGGRRELAAAGAAPLRARLHQLARKPTCQARERQLAAISIGAAKLTARADRPPRAERRRRADRQPRRELRAGRRDRARRRPRHRAVGDRHPGAHHRHRPLRRPPRRPARHARPGPPPRRRMGRQRVEPRELTRRAAPAHRNSAAGCVLLIWRVAARRGMMPGAWPSARSAAGAERVREGAAALARSDRRAPHRTTGRRLQRPPRHARAGGARGSARLPGGR